MSRSILRPDSSTRAYVEPHNAAVNRAGTVLLGAFTFVFRKNAAGEWHRASDNILGAFIDPQARMRLLPSFVPPAAAASPRITVLDDSTFGVLVLQLTPGDAETRVRPVESVWFGQLRNGSWRDVRKITVPDSMHIRQESVSSLVRMPDGTLAWSAIVESGGRPRDIAVFKRVRQTWRSEVLPGLWAAYADLIHADSSQLMLAAVYSDKQLRADANSLFLWAEQPSWHELKKLVPGSATQIHQPVYRDGWLAWYGIRPDNSVGLYAALGPSGEPVQSIANDDDFPGHSPVLTRLRDRTIFVAEKDVEQRAKQILFFAADKSRILPAGESLLPFLMTPAVVKRDRNDFTLFGAVYDSTTRVPETMAVNFRLTCS
jgi:hypothetical protein